VNRTAVGAPLARVAAHGLRVDLPQRWEARLYLRDATTTARESANPIVHLGNFALPPGRGDYGSGAVEVMRAPHAFVALVEFGAAEADTPLFAARGIPRPELDDFAPNALQRRLPGQLGVQRFFTENGRAFCLYVVLGSARFGRQLVGEVHDVLDNVAVSGR
jgi:hypothetical protein